ncbi:3-hydroxyacyl-CoA dehydrogenase [Aurantimonas sp. 22II-16-19i]|uniref:3-hydroxyacyl-CoA dehydrogenase n=1 Tax=Aurantimonas sp. 22II-16-19i TaxID=1317114 RepID=UPI0009F7E791|nr:3-hydroxyacyl-CoA dehydrogenase [Aurantimonas sp. 22II-16-19i]ORE97931.1 3-hydroxy-acyl-CoA dehydrogenase [Aurantimonas sp. 22II-16-19i]
MNDRIAAFGDRAAPLTLGIVGAGTMGRGIAQIAAEAGVDVILADVAPDAGRAGRDFVENMLKRKVEKGRMSVAEAEAATRRVRPLVLSDADAYRGFASCDLVIEAVVERMEVKHGVLKALEAAVGPDCILATNTSSLSVTGFAAAAERPERVAGYHFFNPVPLMRVVEVIAGARTAPGTVACLEALARRMGHRPARATDTPGFLVNHAGRAFTSEGLRIVGEGICGFADVDRVMVEAAGFNMGPFQLMDLVGMDVAQAVSESLYRQYYEEPRFRPSPLGAQRKAAGLLGRKSGEGFYVYRGGKAEPVDEAQLPVADSSRRPVWVSGRDEAASEELRQILASAGAEVEASAAPSADALCFVAPWGMDASMAALEEGLDPCRTVAVDMLFAGRGRRTLMTGVVSDRACRDQAHALLAADGTGVSVIHDSPGFVAQRIVASIVNLGCEMAQQRVAAPEDIDAAVTLGLGYPKGPLAFGDAIGPKRILAILAAMHDFYGDPRYRPSPWLVRRARLGVPLTTPEG